MADYRDYVVKPPLNRLRGKIIRALLKHEKYPNLDKSADNIEELVTLQNLLSKWWYKFKKWNWVNVTFKGGWNERRTLH